MSQRAEPHAVIDAAGTGRRGPWVLQFAGGPGATLRSGYLTPYLFLVPAFLYFGVFFFYPVFSNLWISLHQGSEVLTGGGRFVGLENYSRLAQDARFWSSAWVTAIFVIATLVLSSLAGLGLAVTLNRRLRFRTILRATLLFPFMTSMVLVSLVWQVLLHPQLGLLNFLLTSVGLAPLRWLSDPALALPTLILISVWYETGYNMVLFLAGLQGIPAMYYEAAEIDGAGPLATFRYVTLPLLAPMTTFVIISSLFRNSQAFEQFFILTRGGPGRATDVLSYFLYDVAFTNADFGYAGALGFLVSVSLFLVSLAIFILRPPEHEVG